MKIIKNLLKFIIIATTILFWVYVCYFPEWYTDWLGVDTIHDFYLVNGTKFIITGLAFIFNIIIDVKLIRGLK